MSFDVLPARFRCTVHLTCTDLGMYANMFTPRFGSAFDTLCDNPSTFFHFADGVGMTVLPLNEYAQAVITIDVDQIGQNLKTGCVLALRQKKRTRLELHMVHNIINWLCGSQSPSLTAP